MTGGIAGYNEGLIASCENNAFVNVESTDPRIDPGRPGAVADHGSVRPEPTHRQGTSVTDTGRRRRVQCRDGVGLREPRGCGLSAHRLQHRRHRGPQLRPAAPVYQRRRGMRPQGRGRHRGADRALHPDQRHRLSVGDEPAAIRAAAADGSGRQRRAGRLRRPVRPAQRHERLSQGQHLQARRSGGRRPRLRAAAGAAERRGRRFGGRGGGGYQGRQRAVQPAVQHHAGRHQRRQRSLLPWSPTHRRSTWTA